MFGIQTLWEVFMANVTFNEDLCKGCGLCVNACPKQILQLDKERLNNKGCFVQYVRLFVSNLI